MASQVLACLNRRITLAGHRCPRARPRRSARSATRSDSTRRNPPAVVSPLTPALSTSTSLYPSAANISCSRLGKASVVVRPSPAVRLSPRMAMTFFAASASCPGSTDCCEAVSAAALGTGGPASGQSHGEAAGDRGDNQPRGVSRHPSILRRGLSYVPRTADVVIWDQSGLSKQGPESGPEEVFIMRRVLLILPASHSCTPTGPDGGRRAHASASSRVRGPADLQGGLRPFLFRLERRQQLARPVDDAWARCRRSPARFARRAANSTT